MLEMHMFQEPRVTGTFSKNSLLRSIGEDDLLWQHSLKERRLFQKKVLLHEKRLEEVIRSNHTLLVFENMLISLSDLRLLQPHDKDLFCKQHKKRIEDINDISADSLIAYFDGKGGVELKRISELI